ncbi:hypothetical protein ANCDUO_10760 [Ancylostoma duodenale]|uniref:Uncharacterized protein n=1 Tax=Ancylostoma duodenale TaxID=51022 RepID=A0A0C2GJH9_9BILA|nr:hypothetical protein ANCDUO_10760 [Ancylostoma duodenale]
MRDDRDNLSTADEPFPMLLIFAPLVFSGHPGTNWANFKRSPEYDYSYSGEVFTVRTLPPGFSLATTTASSDYDYSMEDEKEKTKGKVYFDSFEAKTR